MRSESFSLKERGRRCLLAMMPARSALRLWGRHGCDHTRRPSRPGKPETVARGGMDVKMRWGNSTIIVREAGLIVSWGENAETAEVLQTSEII